MLDSVGQRWATGINPDRENRERDDWYPTPPEGTRALLRVEKFEGTIWEPACGDGAISKILEETGHTVISTDLVDRGYGTPRVDFPMEFGIKADNIVTNPPFKMTMEFMEHGVWQAKRKCALLGRLAWLEGNRRRAFFERTPFARVWVFSKRLKMQRARQSNEDDASGMIAFAWFVWDHSHTGKPSLGWI